ncbi:TPA: hypothetical protein N0F65_001302 [Lagenidium giganteum]|uniref:Bms1-type G domain-containing protein n=1 Tax=Lagenidium giganteum TaxID=4803 RepID=A0AAV2Z2J8_9STRA|nr:TPA: hypothetical protein N0F65_001302 [Lagenidium giganteum]
MAGHHHRSGPLKQQNKKHKTGKHDSKNLIVKKSGGKVENRPGARKTNNAAAQAKNNKAARTQRQKDLRQGKKEELMLQRRFGSGSTLGPPKIVALVGLSGLANLREVEDSILESANQIEEPQQHGLLNCTVGIFTQHKQKVCLIECGNDLLVSLDAAKVADILVYVLPMHEGPDSCVSDEGERIISAIRSQGVPSVVGVIQGLEGHAAKAQADLRKYGTRFFQTEFGDAVKITQGNMNSQLTRTLMTTTPKTIHWRDARSYMLGMAAKITPNGPGNDKGTLEISGYIRGKPLSVNQLIHITDVGTFQMSHISQGQLKVAEKAATEKMEMEDATAVAEHEFAVLARADPSIQEDLRCEAEYDPFAAEQTWPTNEELEEAEQDAKQRRKDGDGMSSYQAAWIDGDDDEEGDSAMKDDDDEADEPVDQSFCQTSNKDAQNDDDDDDDMSMEDEDEATRARKYEEMKEKRRMEADNMTFPDEVDIPGDSLGKVRFARYRGLKSMRTSEWDPKESLPQDYARLFQFADFANVQRLALARGKEAELAMKAELRRKTNVARSRAASIASAMDDVDSDLPSLLVPEFGSNGYIASGVFVTLHVRDVPLQAYQNRVQAGPLVLGALLKHENRMSVLNFSIQRASTFTDPIKSKEELAFHCGFRRFTAKPIYSDQSLKSDKHLFQRFLPQGGWSVATIYAPVTFQPASVLMFRENGMIPHELVASGTLMSVNPDRIVLKRVVITGTPVKVKKRKAVIRYMFHSPEDVRWFKPVELVTKHGMTGHIKESLGTHGDFKAVFNKPVKQHDTICLNLYKRVYPKFHEQPRY